MHIVALPDHSFEHGVLRGKCAAVGLRSCMFRLSYDTRKHLYVALQHLPMIMVLPLPGLRDSHFVGGTRRPSHGKDRA